MEWLYAVLLGYFFGSLPFGYWFGLIQGKNLLAEGGVNLEFTEAWRVLSGVPGGMVLILDLVKGLMAVALGEFVMRGINAEWGGLIAGAMAVVGHCFSLWLLGRGGVGYTPALGVLFAVNPIILGTAVGLTALGFLLRRNFNQALMLMGLVLPIASFAITQNLSYLWFGFGVALPIMLKVLLEQQIASSSVPTSAKVGTKAVAKPKKTKRKR